MGEGQMVGPDGCLILTWKKETAGPGGNQDLERGYVWPVSFVPRLSIKQGKKIRSEKY